MLHSNVSYPVICVVYVDGMTVNIRRKGGGTVEDAAVALVRSMLPQNSITKQEVNHDRAASCVSRPAAVSAGDAGGVGDVLRRGEAGAGL